MKNINTTKKNAINAKVTSAKVETANDIILDAIDGVLNEAVRHFNTPSYRNRGDEERYFYNKEEVEKVMSLLYVPESVICTPDYNKDGSVFCYIISRNYKNMPLLRMYVADLKAKKSSQKKASYITKESKVNVNVAV